MEFKQFLDLLDELVTLNRRVSEIKRKMRDERERLICSDFLVKWPLDGRLWGKNVYLSEVSGFRLIDFRYFLVMQHSSYRNNGLSRDVLLQAVEVAIIYSLNLK